MFSRWLVDPLRSAIDFQPTISTWLALAALTAAIGFACRAAMLSRRVRLLGVAAGAALLTATASPTWERPNESRVIVAVDLSASTRGATFRDRAILDQRVRELLGKTPFQIAAFADGVMRPVPAASTLPDLPCDQTRFVPPAAAAAVVLFSDGRFDPPSSACPPIYAVTDSALESPDDGAVESVTRRGDRLDIVARGGTSPRSLAVDGGEPTKLAAGASSQMITVAGTSGREVTARVSPSDRWPENDVLTRRADPPAGVTRWFIGRVGLREGDREIDPAALPLDGGEWLSASAVVMTRDAASRLPADAARQLDRYVRSLGGSLILIDDATRETSPTLIDPLLPLSLDPPTPQRRWVMLVDASGSMAEPIPGGGRRFDIAAAAMRAALDTLPMNDPVTVASFAESLRPWATADKPASIDRVTLPPRDVVPNGPTNLRAALDNLASTADAQPRELVVLTDGDADLGDESTVAATLKHARIRANFVLTSGRANAAVDRLAAATGGTVRRVGEAQAWASAVRDFVGTRRLSVPLAVDVAPDGEAPSPRIARLRRAWLKTGAAVLSNTAFADGTGSPVAASWRIGAGRVIATACATSDDRLAAWLARVAERPRDPRLSVMWNLAAGPSVRIDATDAGRPMNGLMFDIQTVSSAGVVQKLAVPQVEPGRYEMALARSSESYVARLLHDDALVDAVSVPGGYAAEFDAVGNDVPRLAEFAERTGGRLVLPGEHSPIDFRFPRRRVDLSPLFAGLATTLIVVSLIVWKLG